MLSLIITVEIVILFPCLCLAQVTLFQRSTEVRLGVGNSLELACTVTGAIDSSRGWTGGPGFLSLIADGISTDTSKYTETLQTVDFSLHIHNVVVDDVCNVNYQCSNGFQSSQIETIVLNSSIFSYVPTGPEIIVQNEVYDTDKKMTILVNLTKVFPEPACTAKLGNKDVTFLSNSYDNGNCGLKSIELSITNETFDCSGNLKIECTVGSNPLTVYDVKPSSCDVTTKGSTEGDVTTKGSTEGDVTTKGSTEGKTSKDSSNTGAIVGGTTAGGVALLIGTGGAIYKKMKGSDEEQNEDKKDKKKDKKDEKKDSDEEQDKVEHVDESQPKHKSTDKKHQKDGTNDSLLNKKIPSNKLPPLDLEEIKKGKEKETHDIKTK